MGGSHLIARSETQRRNTDPLVAFLAPPDNSAGRRGILNPLRGNIEGRNVEALPI
jgi:hypothetical protein